MLKMLMWLLFFSDKLVMVKQQHDGYLQESGTRGKTSQWLTKAKWITEKWIKQRWGGIWTSRRKQEEQMRNSTWLIMRMWFVLRVVGYIAKSVQGSSHNLFTWILRFGLNYIETKLLWNIFCIIYRLLA